MRILFIDYLSPKGHKTFNTIQIQALCNLGIDVDVFIRDCAHSDYVEKLKVANVYKIPNRLYLLEKNKSLYRLGYMLILLYVHLKCKKNKYDKIIYSSFEDISLSMSFYLKDAYAFAHNNLEGWEKSRIKRYFAKKLNSRMEIIVFNELMQESIKKYLLGRSKIISHGLPEKWNDFKTKPLGYNFIFIPSANCLDEDFINSLLDDEAFLNYLEDSDKYIVLKKYSDKCFESDRIKIIDYYLSDDEYKNLLLNSSEVLLTYTYTLSQRTSAVLLECIANDIKVLLKDSKQNPYDNLFQYKYQFQNIQQLISLLKEKEAHASLYNTHEYIAPEQCWRKILLNK